MTRKLLAALAFSAAALLAAAPAMAQTDPAVAAKGYKAPRNPWGQPDLSGVWSPATITRLERDPALKDRLVMTDAEAKALEGENAAFNAKDLAKSDLSVKVDDLECGVKGFPRGPECGYNNFWVDPGTKVLRIAGQPRASILVTPKDGRLPLKPEALARQRAQFGNARVGNFDGPERRPLGERCLVGFGSTSGPPMLPVLYNNHYQIQQTRDQVVIVVEMVHDARIIRLNDKHRPNAMPTWMGDSIGWWEGDTLVVETTQFNPGESLRPYFDNTIYLSQDAKVTERFTRISKDQILYQFSVDDPKVYARPWKAEMPLNASKGPVYEYACHEGNYSLPGILAGARKAESEGRKPDAVELSE